MTSGTTSRIPSCSVVRPLVSWVGVAALLSWGATHAAYRVLGVDFGGGVEGAVADWAPLVLPLVIAPLTTLPRIRLQNRLALANALLEAEVRRAQLLQAELRHQSRHDPLTGALNRRGFFEEAVRLQRAGAVVLLADLDGFKSVNDEHGHAAGDLVLQMIAEVLSERCGAAGGFVGRLGGDEFVAVLPLEGMAAAREACADLEDLPVVLADGTELRVRASVGLVQISAGQSVDEGLALVDAEMYARKRGRVSSR